MQHGFRRLLQKNLLLLTLPVVIVLAALLLLLGQVSRLEHFQTVTMQDSAYAEEFFLSGQRNVEVSLPGLTSTGFVYMVGDKEQGEYFYRIHKDMMEVVLLESDTAAKQRAGAVEGDLFTVRLIKDDVTAGYILREYAQAMGTPAEEFFAMGSVYLFNEIAYPRTRILVLKIVLVSLTVLLGVVVLYVLLATAFPVLNYEALVLRRFGKTGRYIRKLDREMEKKLKMHQDNVWVTENFLVVSYLTHIDVVRIDDIKYLSKHVEKKRRGVGRPVRVYRLTASNSDDLFFEADFFDEGIVNDVIYYMKGEPLLEFEEISERERLEEEERMEEVIAEEREREEMLDAEQELYEQFDRDELY